GQLLLGRLAVAVLALALALAVLGQPAAPRAGDLVLVVAVALGELVARPAALLLLGLAGGLALVGRPRLLLPALLAVILALGLDLGVALGLAARPALGALFARLAVLLGVGVVGLPLLLVLDILGAAVHVAHLVVGLAVLVLVTLLLALL